MPNWDRRQRTGSICSSGLPISTSISASIIPGTREILFLISCAMEYRTSRSAPFTTISIGFPPPIPLRKPLTVDWTPGMELTKGRSPSASSTVEGRSTPFLK